MLSEHVLHAASCRPREPPVVSLMDQELKMEKNLCPESLCIIFFQAVLVLKPHSVFGDLSYLFRFDYFCSSNEQKIPQKR